MIRQDTPVGESNPLLAAALQYAAMGLAVFPVHSVGDGRCTCGDANCDRVAKHPRTINGLKDGTTDERTIRAWWRRWPDANVAIATGADSNIVVIDNDPRNGGDETLARLEHEHGELPLTPTVLTGGEDGGNHFAFAHPGIPIKNRTGGKGGWPEGLDVRGDGGYVVAPPSIHASGRRYQWKPGLTLADVERAALPAWLLDKMTADEASPSLQPRSESTKRRAPDSDHELLITAATRYTAAVSGQAKGGRDDAAFNLAGHLAAFVVEESGLRLTESETLSLLQTWDMRNSEPLGEAELAKKVHSAFKGNGTPRSDHVVQRQWRSEESEPGDSSRGTTKAFGGSVSSSKGARKEFVWSEPHALPTELAKVEPFDMSSLPSSLQGWIADITERMQCPPDFAAVAAMVVAAGLLGRKVGIRPKRFDDWLVVANLWGMVIGRPGIMKTPAISEAINVAKRLEIEAQAEHGEAMKVYEAAQIVAKVRRKACESDIKKDLKTGGDGLGIAAAVVEEESSAPTRTRYLVNDPSVEKLGEILKENPNGVIVFRDELVGLLKALEKEGQEAARAFYLEAWNGTGRYTYDRIARGTIDIEAAIISVLGGIQPSRLSEYLRAAVQGGTGDDGLMQRFQLAVWPDVSSEWVNVDRWPTTSAKQAAFDAYARLRSLDPEAIGAEHDRFDEGGSELSRDRHQGRR
ncbi:MAG: DUF3987 domain-containing protein [Pirellulales bacterium]